MSAHFSFNLQGHGWAICGIEADDAKFEWMAAHHPPDPFAATLEAFAELLRGCPDAKIEYLDLPHGRTLSLVPQGNGRVRLSMVRYADWSYRNHGTAEPEFEIEVRLRTLAGSMLATAQAISEAEGEAGFQAKWRPPFPHDAVAQLQAELKRKR